MEAVRADGRQPFAARMRGQPEEAVIADFVETGHVVKVSADALTSGTAMTIGMSSGRSLEDSGKVVHMDARGQTVATLAEINGGSLTEGVAMKVRSESGLSSGSLLQLNAGSTTSPIQGLLRILSDQQSGKSVRMSSAGLNPGLC